MAVKAIILIGGPNKGQRFRPLSFDSPKYMFPVGGESITGHLIRQCLKVKNLSEIILLGFYPKGGMLSPNNLHMLLKRYAQDETHGSPVPTIRYLPELNRMGTAGGLYYWRRQIKQDNPDAFLLINGDVCGDFDFEPMIMQHEEAIKRCANSGSPKPLITLMTTEAGRNESLSYGCIVEDPKTHVVTHYVEKPSTFVSNLINCGNYVCSPELLDILEDALLKKRQELSAMNPPADAASLTAGQIEHHSDYLSLELDILQQDWSQSRCYAYRTTGQWWCQVKTAASAIYANRQYLKQFAPTRDRESKGLDRDCTIIGEVYIHPSAVVDSSAVIGPNVSIMENCVLGAGVRVKESIILEDAVINAHSLILCSIVGWSSSIGKWVRIEGTPSEPDPNERHAKVQNPALFNPDGKLNPSISVLGCNVKIPDCSVILNSIVLPHKELARSYKNEIVL